MRKANTILTLEQARLLSLQNQGLIAPQFGKGKAGTLRAINHLSYIQIDTLSVAARAHHHTLWSRVGNYEERYLNELLEKDRSIFEYWSHAASYLPMSDYRYSLPRKRSYEEGKSHWFDQDKKMNKFVLDRIKAEGPLQSKDFESISNGPGNWYEWKPAKKALEQLFMEGKLMVKRRQGFQKVYDLTERVVAANVDTSLPTEKQYAEYLIGRAVQANGVVEEKEISYLRKGLKTTVNTALKKMLKDGTFIEVGIEGDPGNMYVTTDKQMKALQDLKTEKQIHILSPFDNMIIQRKRIKRFFDFDYVIECYLPEAKRKFGYFCLPILYDDRFVARFDPKADRASKVFYIKSMHFEKGFKPDENFNNFFAQKLKAYATFTGCDKIEIEKADKVWKKEIKSLVDFNT
ncbi:MAG: winged helix-turn-helix domain-containing protein [Bacteroidetes bacterium]|nr:winged helix-turn-helix domain-containing protein [Bacteroidota bacterium]